jgi:hypothetical protein
LQDQGEDQIGGGDQQQDPKGPKRQKTFHDTGEVESILSLGSDPDDFRDPHFEGL